MKHFYGNMRNGYEEAIDKGIKAAYAFRRFTRIGAPREEALAKLRAELDTAEKIVIGAGAGLSTSAGHVYSGARFQRYFGDFSQRFGITDMYSGGFYPFPDEETHWAWWSRHIYVNRYMKAEKPVYDDLLSLVKDKDYFVITTNVDHQFQLAGFDKRRLFYTQGDYGLFQSTDSRNRRTYDNEDMVRAMVHSQGWEISEDGDLVLPEGVTSAMKVPPELIPVCPDDGRPFTLNLRSDDTFLEDEGWHAASERYALFLDGCEDRHVLFLEIGVGSNTPVIIKYPFWQMTAANRKAVYACLNYTEAFYPRDLEDRSILLDGDTGEVLKALQDLAGVSAEE